MAKLIQKPTISSAKDVGTKGVAGAVGFLGYDEAKKLSPIPLEPMHEAGIAVGAVAVASSTKNMLLQMAMIGLALSAGISSAKAYGVLPASQEAEVAKEEALNGLGYDSTVEYYNPYDGMDVMQPIADDIEFAELNGLSNENADLM